TDPLHWHTLSIAGQPTLVALRQVGTPDGRLTQGFLVEPSGLAAWLGQQGLPAAAIAATSPPPGSEAADLNVAGGTFHVAVAPPPAELAAAGATAHAARVHFYQQFFPIAGLAALLGAVVVLMVARSE